MSTIEWNSEGKYGYQVGTVGMRTLMYRPAYGFRKYLEHLLNAVVHDPKNFQHNKLLDKSLISPVHLIYPKFITRNILDKADIIKKCLLSEFKKYLDTTQSSTSNFEFLARLSLHREWNHSCMICLEHQYMGRSCGYGPTEIIIFRPCGHSMCSSPCFQTYSETNPNICPLCRASISDLFEAGQCYYDNSFDAFLDSVEASLTNQCAFTDLFIKYSH